MFSLFQPMPGYSSLFQPILDYSHLFQHIPSSYHPTIPSFDSLPIPCTRFLARQSFSPTSIVTYQPADQQTNGQPSYNRASPDFPFNCLTWVFLEFGKIYEVELGVSTVSGPHSYLWGECYQQGLPCLVFIPWLS